MHAANTLIVAIRAQQPTQAEVKLRNKILHTLFQSKEHSSSHQTDYASHKARNPNPVPGTCTWILENSKYQYWRDTLSSRLLHLSADAGCGKSVLASFLIDTLSNALSQSELTGQVCYFFFKDDNTVQSSAVYALRALLHQCLAAKSTLPKTIIDAYRTKGDALFDQFSCLWEAFKSLTCGDCGENIICILDGLDECNEDSRHLLVASLVNFFNDGSGDHGPFLKVIVSS
jgi:hypothetical protein